MIKLICVAAFSSHYFKEISSLSKFVEQFLNLDKRLDINAPKEERPSLEQVIQEIQKTRTKNNQHQNNRESAFRQKSPNDFPLLGLTTERDDELLTVKGKPISFKSRSKGTIDITIRNPQEFTSFIH